MHCAQPDVDAVWEEPNVCRAPSMVPTEGAGKPEGATLIANPDHRWTVHCRPGTGIRSGRRRGSVPSRPTRPSPSCRSCAPRCHMPRLFPNHVLQRYTHLCQNRHERRAENFTFGRGRQGQMAFFGRS